MELHTIIDYINNNIVNNTLIITNNEEKIENAFHPLLYSLGNDSIKIEECDLYQRPVVNAEEFTLKGKSVIKGINSGKAMSVSIVGKIKDDDFYYTITMATNEKVTFEKFFGKAALQEMYIQQGLVKRQSALNEILLVSPKIWSDLSNSYEKLPFIINSSISFEKSKQWNKYAYLLSGANWFTGRLTFEKRISYEVYSIYQGEIKLYKKAAFELPNYNEDNKLKNIIENAELFIYLSSGLIEEDFDISDCCSFAQIGCRLLLLGMKKEILLKADLFKSEDYWKLNSYFYGGLGIGDIVNFFASILNLKGKEEILLPTDSSLNALKLYNLRLTMSKNSGGLNLYLKDVSIVAGTDKPWVLPFKYITLNNLKLSWYMQWGNLVKNKRSSLLVGQVSANMDIELFNDKYISLYMTAELPYMDFEAHIKLIDNKNIDTYSVEDVIGKTANELPGFTKNNASMTLETLDIYASYSGRELTIYTEIDDLLSFNIGQVNISLSKLYAQAEFSQKENSYTFGGSICFTDSASIKENDFELYLRGKYSKGNWIFEGGIENGTIKIGSLIKHFLGSNAIYDYKNANYVDIELTKLNIKYEYNKKLQISNFFINARFNAYWGEIFGIPVQNIGALLLKTGKDGVNYISAMLALKMGIFNISVQADNFNTAKPVYILQIYINNSFLRASYAVEKGDELVVISLKNISLGDIIACFVTMLNPVWRFSLPSPWNVLNKIDLSSFSLKLNLTKHFAEFNYKLNLDILGVLKIESIGMCYTADSSSNSNGILEMVVATNEEEYKWNAVTESPPDIVNNPKKFKLKYLGLGQHFSSPEIKKAGTITDAIKAFKDTFNVEKQTAVFDEEINWLFGTNFSINEALNVSVVLNDPILYGILITVDSENKPFGQFKGLMLELIYKKVTKTIGMFKASLILPESMRRFQLGAVNITFGSVSLEIYTNGDFFMDLGFPHNMDFTQSFSLEFGIWCGRGGLYFGILSGATFERLPKTESGVFGTVVTLGLGLSIGLGRSFDFGVIAAGLSIEVYGVFEGVFAVFHPNNKLKDNLYNELMNTEDSLYFYAKTTLGIVGKLFVKMDLKIISLDVSAEVKAFAIATFESYKPTIIELDLYLELKARIKILFIKINFSFTFKQNVKFTIGEEETAPWEIPNNIKYNIPNEWVCFTTDKISNDNWQIEIGIQPFFSLVNENKYMYCTAFVPIIENKNYICFINMLANWLLFNFDEIIIKEFSDYLTPEILKSEVDYNCIDKFFENNVTFKVHSIELNHKDFSEEIEGAVFPMLPPIHLTFGEEDNNNLIDVEYWNDNYVSEDYAQRLYEYFESMDIFDDSENNKENLSANKSEPLAQIIFTDYIHMIIRQLMKQIRNMFDDEFSVDSDIFIFKSVYDDYGIKPENVLKDNLNLYIKPAQFEVYDKVIYAEKNDTISSISSSFGVFSEQVIIKNYNSLSIIDNNSKIQTQGFIFNNKDLKLKIVIAASLMFVRYGKYESESYYYKYVDDIYKQIENQYSKSNSLDKKSLDIDWEDLGNNHINIYIPYKNESFLWTTMPGDTVIRLSKMTALLNFEKGIYIEWDAYLKSIKNINKAEENSIIDNIIFPSEEISLYEDKTIGELVRRIIPIGTDYKCITEQPIFKPMARINVGTVTYKLEQEETISNFMNFNNVSFSEMSRVFCSDKQQLKLLENQKIWLKQIKKLPKKLILERLIDDKNCLSIASSTSRFLMQGLRLPEILIDKLSNATLNETNGFYNMMKQQTILERLDKEHIFTVSISKSDCLWAKGQFETVISTDVIEKYLPNIDFNWKNYFHFTQNDENSNFVKSSKIYTISSTITVQYSEFTKSFLYNKRNIQKNEKCESLHTLPHAIHLFSEELAKDYSKMENPQLFCEKNRIDIEETGFIFPIEIKMSKKSSNISTINGISLDKRENLKLLMNIFDDLELEGSSVHYELLYKPSKLDGAANTLIGIDRIGKIIKTNLSRETKMFFENKFNENEYQQKYAANIGSGDFIRLLWECSIIGGGYFLYLENPLPENIFDDSDKTTIWVLAYETNNKNLKQNGIINCAMSYETVQTVSQSADCEQIKPLILHISDEHNEELTEWKTLLPPGSYRITLEADEPDNDRLKAYENLRNSYTYSGLDDFDMRELFSIISYNIEGKGYYSMFKNESKPIIPKYQEKYNKWNYDINIPLYKLIEKGNDNPYLVLNKQVQINVNCRDVLGNYAVDYLNYNFIPKYNDFIIGFNEWGISISYSIKNEINEKNPCLYIKFSIPSNIQTDNLANKEHAKLIKRSLYQLKTTKMVCMLECSLVDKIDFNSVKMEKIIEFAEELLSFYEGKKQLTSHEIILKFDLKDIHVEKITKLTVNIILKRLDVADIEAERAVYCTCNVYPDINSESTESYTSNAKVFAENFEAAIENCKIATGGDEKSDIYVVSFGENGIVSNITIMPFNIKYAVGTIKAPIYYAFSPLCNKLINKSINVSSLADDYMLDEDKHEEIFVNIDLDVWANNLLQDIEACLSEDYIQQLSTLDEANINDLISVKEILAEKISHDLLALNSSKSFTTNDNKTEIIAQGIAKEKLCKNLKKGFATSSIAEYELVINCKEHVRFSISLIDKLDKKCMIDEYDNKNFSAQPSKIDSLKNKFYIVYDSYSSYITGFTPNFEIQINEIEFDIKEEHNGYETSKWLRFIIPIDENWSKDIVDFDLTTDIYVPNPLRGFPFSPKLIGQGIKDYQNTEDHPFYEWEHYIDCQTTAATQDTLHFTIAYDNVEAVLYDNQKDLFGCLCQYEYVRLKLLKAIMTNSPDNIAFKTWVSLIKLVAENWDIKFVEQKRFICNNSEQIAKFEAVLNIQEENMELKYDKEQWSLCSKILKKPILGEEYSFSVFNNGLNIYDKNTAAVEVYIIRNENLLKVSKKYGEYYIPVAPQFIYESEKQSLSQFYASIIKNNDIIIGKVEIPLCIEAIKQAFSILKDKLGMHFTYNKADLVIWYSYSLDDSNIKKQIELPAVMYTEMDCSKIGNEQMVEYFYNWVNDVSPSTNNSALIFNINIYSKLGNRVILNLSRCKILFSGYIN